MRTIALTSRILAVAGAMALAAAAADAAPQACGGAYAVAGTPLVLGGATGSVARVLVRGVEAVPSGFGPGMQLGTCQATSIIRAPRDDAFILRGRFVDCGDLGRFRLRLAFDADCERVSGRVRSHGRLVREFTAALVHAAGPVAPGAPVAPSVPVAPGTPVEPSAPADGTRKAVGTKPSITAFSPLTVRPGGTLSLFGTNLDHDKNGNPWTGPTPPYLVTFVPATAAPTRIVATPVFVSSSELRVTVPSLAGSGTIVLAERRSSFASGAPLAETDERLVVVTQDALPAAPVPSAGTPPTTRNQGTLTVVATDTSLFDAGTFTVTGGAFQIGAFLDTNANGLVDLIGGANDVPYPAFPERSSEFDFSIQAGRGYFPGANAMLWIFFEGGDPSVLTRDDRFFVVHLAVDLVARTARPVAMLAGVGGDPGIVMIADQFGQADITVPPPGGGVGALRGRIAAVPTFLENIFFPSQPGVCDDPSGFCPDFGPSIEQRRWANGVTIDFDVPLFADNRG